MSTSTRTVVKVTGRGPTTSFRYPHFVVGDQPTFLIPPPSTTYGHMCSAAGRQLPPGSLSYAIHFRYDSRGTDYELLHYGSRHGQATPVRREILYGVVMTLYVEPPELLEVFRRPVFPVALGRTQDLFTYQSVSLIDLEQADQAYFEHTLLPAAYAPCFATSEAVALPRLISPDRRFIDYGQYAVLHQRGIWPDPDGFWRYDDEIPTPMWIDPGSAPDEEGRQLGLIFHSFA